MSKEELLKYLIAEIDLIMHDKDYRFENANGTWYSRESCRDLTNEEVFEELRTELRQLADLEAKLEESERQANDWKQRFESIEERNKQITDNSVKALELKNEKIKELKQQLANALKDFNDIQEENDKLAQQLAEKDKKIEDVEDVSRRLIRTCGKTNCYGKNQTAIEKLEQVKKLLVEKMKLASDKLDCAYYIDNQIKELRGEENE